MEHYDNKLKNYNIIKGNILNSSKFDIGLLEYRIILAALSKIKNTDIDFEKLDNIEFTVKEFDEIYNNGITNKIIYNNLKNACEKLITRSVIIELENKYVMIQWVKRIEFPKREGKIIISFHDDIKPFIIYMKNNQYTKYILKNIIKLKSIYSIRIYELLKQYEKIGERTFKLDEFKTILGLDKNNYKQFGSFKLRILESAKKELANKSDLCFTYTEILQVKKVIGIKFIIFKNNNNEFKLYDKLELYKILKKLIIEKFGHLHITVSLIEKHRFILIDLIKTLENGTFTNIKYPKKFIESLIIDITNRYDLTNIKDY